VILIRWKRKGVFGDLFLPPSLSRARKTRSAVRRYNTKVTSLFFLSSPTCASLPSMARTIAKKGGRKGEAQFFLPFSPSPSSASGRSRASSLEGQKVKKMASFFPPPPPPSFFPAAGCERSPKGASGTSRKLCPFFFFPSLPPSCPRRDQKA